MEFNREEGEGGAAQRWIDGNLPVCPLCRAPSLWATATGADQQALVRWYFQCSSCKSVLSTIPEKSVQALSEPVPAASAPLQTYVRVDSAGRPEDEDFVGQEFALYELQEWADEADE